MARAKKLFTLAFALMILLGWANAGLLAQTSPNPSPYDPLIKQIQQARTKLAPQMRYMSGGMLSAFALANHWEGLKAGLSQAAKTSAEIPLGSATISAQPFVTTLNPSSRILGFTQSETSTAWCGTNAVVGFNDTGSVLETSAAALAGGGLSFVGYGQSTNANATSPVFTDKGALTAANGSLLIGDPVVTCTSASNFFVSNVSFDCIFVNLNGSLTCLATNSTVSVSMSTDGGTTFTAPVTAVSKSAATHLLDKDWMAIDQTNHEYYVGYTDFDTDLSNVCGNIAGIVPITRVAIEIVSSTDGQHWSAPVEVTHVCANPSDASANAAVQGSQIAIGTGGSVYVAWEATDLSGGGLSQHEIDISTGNIGATTFSTPSKVTDVNCAGDCTDGILQGSIRIAELPSLVAGGGAQTGKLFMAWNDGDNPQPDLGIGTYNLTDVKLMSSSNGGVTWSAPVKVNNSTNLTDHFQPAVASDRSGRVAVCFYDRRNDANNFYIDRYCANSTNGGASFSTNTRVTPKSFLSVVNQDLQLNAGGVIANYMGDYDTLAPDSLNANNGFRGGFAYNGTGAPNVLENKY